LPRRRRAERHGGDHLAAVRAVLSMTCRPASRGHRGRPLKESAARERHQRPRPASQALLLAGILLSHPPWLAAAHRQVTKAVYDVLLLVLYREVPEECGGSRRPR
jgi:hypothetical protein